MKTLYIVNRQRPWMGEPCIEIACGRDNCSPGMLVPQHSEEGAYDTREDAVDAALALQRITDLPIVVNSSACMGLYSDGENEWSKDELEAWVQRGHDPDVEPDYDDHYEEGLDEHDYRL